MKLEKKNPAFPGAGYWRTRNILLLLLLICGMGLGVKIQRDLSGNSSPFTEATLEYVVDGDTIYVTVDGERTKIRLIGIDTPESVSETKENTPEGEAASEYVRGFLKQGQELYLEYDQEPFDKYGRTLAYVWLKANADTTSFDDFRKYNLSAVIYQNTYCALLNIPPNTMYADWFEDLEPYQDSAAS